MESIAMHKKPDRKERVLQFGGGGFLRGFFDWMLQKLCDCGAFDGSVVVVRSVDRGNSAGIWEEQNCNYTHIMRGAEGVETTLVDVISRSIHVKNDFSAYLETAKNPDMRFIVSNTTESGIVFSDSDTFDAAEDGTFPAKVTRLLYERFRLGLGGYIFLPCELIDRNGDTLRDTILRYGALWQLGEDFSAWVTRENIFCNTLVDRINTGYPKGEAIDLPYTDRLLNTSEFYHLFVIETDYDLEAELPFSAAGLNVILTSDQLEAYRTRKVRILNGAHTSLVPYALLSGFDTVKSCIDDSAMCAYLKKCVFDEIIPTLDLPKDELLSYADSVLTRFSNPYIRHYLADISLNSVSKFRVRVLPSILAYTERFGKAPETLLFAFLNLIAFYRTDRTRDSADVVAFMQSHTGREILQNTDFWGRDLSFLCADLARVCASAPADSPIRSEVFL